MPDKFTDIPIAQTANAEREANPYASPLTEGRLVAKHDPDAPIGIWRFGNALIMHADATLPDRCILTNAECDKSERRVYLISSIRLINIMSAILIIMALCGAVGIAIADWSRNLVWSIIIVAMTVSAIWKFYKKRPEAIPIGYSYSHKARQRRLGWRCGGVILFGLGLGCFPLIAPFQQWVLVFLIGGPLLLLIGGVLVAAFGFPLRFEKNAGPYFLIHGCGKAFVRSFPESGFGASPIGSFVAKRFT